MSDQTPKPTDPEKDQSDLTEEEIEQHRKEWKKEEVRKDAMRVLRKIPIILVVGYLIFHTFFATREYTEGLVEDRYVFEDSLELYQAELASAIEMRNSQVDVDVSDLGVTEILDDEGTVVTTGNFEGPQLFLESMEFGAQVIDLQKHPGVENYSVTSLLFDPDHTYLGLPNLDVRVSPVKIYEPEQGKIEAILGSIKNLLPGRGQDEKPKPYAVYTKEVKLGDGTLRKVAMQLWLTEFKVTVSARPDILPNKKELKRVQELLQEKIENPPKVNSELHDKISAEIKEYTFDLDSLQSILNKKQEGKADREEELAGKQANWDKLRREIDKNEKRLIQKANRKRRQLQKELEGQKTELLARIDSVQSAITRYENQIRNIEKEMQPLLDSIHQRNEALREIEVQNNPSSWYGDEDIRNPNLSELGKAEKAENENQVYSNISVWLRVMPNTAPWYIKTRDAENLKPKMAIGAIYCTEVLNEVEQLLEEEKVRYKLGSNQAQFDVSEGMAIALYDEMRFKQPIGQNPEVQQLTPLQNSNYYLNAKSNASIWDKPYYMKVFLKNVGSHKSKRLFGRELKEYDDQYTFSFLMPLLVRGSWDIIPPNEVIPDWNPPKPRTVEGFHLSHLLPSWGFSFFGRTLSLLFLIGAIAFILNFFFPGLKDLVGYLSSTLVRWIKSVIQGISKLFKPKTEGKQ